MEPDDHPIHQSLGTLPAPPETTHWWLITPSPMQFENIGFSRPVHAQGPSGELAPVPVCYQLHAILFRKTTETFGMRGM